MALFGGSVRQASVAILYYLLTSDPTWGGWGGLAAAVALDLLSFDLLLDNHSNPLQAYFTRSNEISHFTYIL